MPILKPASAMKSCSRKLSHRQSVRLPWAIVVPNGLSFFARSTSTWIHWWSPDTSANLSMSSWVTSRQSLGPIVSPMSPLSSSMPFTVVGALMRRSISAAVMPRLRPQRRAERALAALEDRLSMRGQDRVEVEGEQRLERRVEALAVEALDLGVHLLRGPHPHPALPLDHGVAEDECVMAREVERHLVAARLPDRVGGDAARQRHA